MANRTPDVGLTIYDSVGVPLGTYRASRDAIDEATALRRYLTEELPEGEYWLVTVREDQCYLLRFFVNDGNTMTLPRTHRYRYPRYATLSDDVRSMVRDLHRALLNGSKVPGRVIAAYIAATGN
jgi:hypothetical protein